MVVAAVHTTTVVAAAAAVAAIRLLEEEVYRAAPIPFRIALVRTMDRTAVAPRKEFVATTCQVTIPSLIRTTKLSQIKASHQTLVTNINGDCALSVHRSSEAPRNWV